MSINNKSIAYFLMALLLGLSGVTYFSAPAKPLDEKNNLVYFQSAEEEASNSLVRPFCDSEETQVRYSPDILLSQLGKFHSVISKVRFTHILHRRNLELPKEDLCVLHSVFLI